MTLVSGLCVHKRPPHCVDALCNHTKCFAIRPEPPFCNQRYATWYNSMTIDDAQTILIMTSALLKLLILLWASPKSNHFNFHFHCFCLALGLSHPSIPSVKHFTVLVMRTCHKLPVLSHPFSSCQLFRCSNKTYAITDQNLECLICKKLPFSVSHTSIFYMLYSDF